MKRKFSTVTSVFIRRWNESEEREFLKMRDERMKEEVKKPKRDRETESD